MAQEVNRLSRAHRSEAQVEQQPHNGIRGHIMLHHQKGPVWLQHANDFPQRPLTDFAKEYAEPVNSRVTLLPQPREFAEAYLAALGDWFLHVQGDYRKRRRAFNTLFKHCPYDPAGSFSYRWECVLRRLDQTDIATVVAAIRKQITVLTGETAA